MANQTTDVAKTAVVLNRDLLFGSRLREALSALGLQGRFVNSTDRFVAALDELGAASVIGIVDMNGPVAWPTLAEAIRAQQDWPPLLAFGPHTDVPNRRAAKGAGVTRIVSNGQFHAEMSGLIDRYRRR